MTRAVAYYNLAVSIHGFYVDIKNLTSLNNFSKLTMQK